MVGNMKNTEEYLDPGPCTQKSIAPLKVMAPRIPGMFPNTHNGNYVPVLNQRPETSYPSCFGCCLSVVAKAWL
eukprot:4453162-Amphidinium_carterae.1